MREDIRRRDRNTTDQLLRWIASLGLGVTGTQHGLRLALGVIDDQEALDTYVAAIEDAGWCARDYPAVWGPIRDTWIENASAAVEEKRRLAYAAELAAGAA